MCASCRVRLEQEYCRENGMPVRMIHVACQESPPCFYRKPLDESTTMKATDILMQLNDEASIPLRLWHQEKDTPVLSIETLRQLLHQYASLIDEKKSE
jgi:hypothetical protein